MRWWRTKVCHRCHCLFSSPADNGLNPVWAEECVLDILCPEMALVRFSVMDEDMFGEPNFLGQACFPVRCIRTGDQCVCTHVVVVELPQAPEDDRSSWKGLTRDATRRLRFVVHAAGWLHSMVIHGRTHAVDVGELIRWTVMGASSFCAMSA